MAVRYWSWIYSVYDIVVGNDYTLSYIRLHCFIAFMSCLYIGVSAWDEQYPVSALNQFPKPYQKETIILTCPTKLYRAPDSVAQTEWQTPRFISEAIGKFINTLADEYKLCISSSDSLIWIWCIGYFNLPIISDDGNGRARCVHIGRDRVGDIIWELNRP